MLEGPTERVCLDARPHAVVVARPVTQALVLAGTGGLLLLAPWPLPVAGPLLLAIAGLLWLGPPWLVGALAWATHIAVDRALGYGPRTREGFRRA